MSDAILKTDGVARGLDGFKTRTRHPIEFQPTGVTELDALLGGGFPRGSLIEVFGSASSGRTGLCSALLAQVTTQQQACAFVDVSDSLDPASLAASGVDLARLLWIRCRNNEIRQKNLSQSVRAKNLQFQTRPWKRLEEGLKATDFLLQNKGWGVVVIDLGSISWVDTRRIPLSTWFRFQRIVENTTTILLLLGEEPCAKSCASIALRCKRKQQQWRRAVSNSTSGVVTLQGFEVEGEVVRSRIRREHTNSAHWEARTY